MQESGGSLLIPSRHLSYLGPRPDFLHPESNSAEGSCRAEGQLQADALVAPNLFFTWNGRCQICYWYLEKDYSGMPFLPLFVMLLEASRVLKAKLDDVPSFSFFTFFIFIFFFSG